MSIFNFFERIKMIKNKIIKRKIIVNIFVINKNKKSIVNIFVIMVYSRFSQQLTFYDQKYPKAKHLKHITYHKLLKGNNQQ